MLAKQTTMRHHAEDLRGPIYVKVYEHHHAIIVCSDWFTLIIPTIFATGTIGFDWADVELKGIDDDGVLVETCREDEHYCSPFTLRKARSPWRANFS